ncbi:MAG: ATP-binding protein [Dictyoglomus sp.]|nr:ATP-binding protein [Dictyoglomus sp.]MCX7941520.1 ATP-binding protein [Dictyoglomaceae bacterium]MDW8187860.1 ATP-binding protein [Dictyoglomus sp.]
MEEEKCVGYLVGESFCDRFQFVTTREKAPKRLEYVTIKGIATPEEEVEVLAQVESLRAFSEVLDEHQEYETTNKILGLNYVIPTQLIAEARVLGYLDKNNNIQFPRSVALPGSPVFLAPDSLLQRFFSHGKSNSIEIGTLLYRPNVKVTLDPNGLRRHLAIIAQTGAGKSYLTGLLIEKLVKLGATILVFDPNSDYVLLRRKRNLKEFSSISENVTIYRIPEIPTRFSEVEMGGIEKFSIKFNELEDEQILEILGIDEKMTNIRNSIEHALQELKSERRDFTPEDLYNKLSQYTGDIDEEKTLSFENYDIEIAKKHQKKTKLNEDLVNGARKALKYVRWIKDYPIWGFEDIKLEKILKPSHITVVDLAGLEKNLMDLIVSHLLNEIWMKAKSEGLRYPLFIVLEEAHNFVPNDKENRGKSARLINTIASEGRKFKVFLIVITQRPYKISSNTLSQCGSQIIMKLTNPNDQNAVKEASEALSESLFRDLPGLNIGEAVIVGNLTRVPVIVKIGDRETAEGGYDIDLEKEFEKARKDSLISEEPFIPLQEMESEI